MLLQMHYFILFNGQVTFQHTPTHPPLHTTSSSVNGHLECFHVLAVVSSATVNIGVHISFQIIVLSGYMPRSGIVGSYGNSAFRFLLFFFFLLRTALAAYGSSRRRGRIGARAASLHQSHSNTGSEPPLQPTPQFMAVPDP